ncbi:Psi-producing oxygenase A [Venturia inaequalis]|nr:Psi-producing oxygenase A [Venturia inaequalis]
MGRESSSRRPPNSACDRCRRRRFKCEEGIGPSCIRCENDDYRCTFALSTAAKRRAARPAEFDEYDSPTDSDTSTTSLNYSALSATVEPDVGTSGWNAINSGPDVHDPGASKQPASTVNQDATNGQISSMYTRPEGHRDVNLGNKGKIVQKAPDPNPEDQQDEILKLKATIEDPWERIRAQNATITDLEERYEMMDVILLKLGDEKQKAEDEVERLKINARIAATILDEDYEVVNGKRKTPDELQGNGAKRQKT